MATEEGCFPQSQSGYPFIPYRLAVSLSDCSKINTCYVDFEKCTFHFPCNIRCAPPLFWVEYGVFVISLRNYVKNCQRIKKDMGVLDETII